MLFFIDETWQTIAGRQVGALGAVAIPQNQYNGFCTAVYAMKKQVLGASELAHSEIKGQNCFTRSAFKRQAIYGDSHWIEAADRMLHILAANQACVFVIWTTTPDLLTLRQPSSTQLSEPYKQLLFDCRALMEREAPEDLGSLNFDLRGTREDEATACTMQNYMVRTRGGWSRHFICIPNFTISAVSPGLQAADMIAYLGARLAAPSERPELQPFVGRMLGLTYRFTRPGMSARSTRTARRIH